MEKKTETKSAPKPQPAKDLAYYFILFTLEGHRTWIMTTMKSFPPDLKVTAQKKFKVDRITGTVKEVK